jgi:hypothetical protein
VAASDREARKLFDARDVACESLTFQINSLIDAVQKLQILTHGYHPRSDHRNDAVSRPPTADTALMVVWTDKIERADFDCRVGPEPTVDAPTLWAIKADREQSTGHETLAAALWGKPTLSP